MCKVFGDILEAMPSSLILLPLAVLVGMFSNLVNILTDINKRK